MESTVFDYAIIGAGAAGLNLAMAMAEDPFFSTKKILILEKESKQSDYPTWSFWEKGSGKWDDIASKTWSQTYFITPEKVLRIDLGEYTYKMVVGEDFHLEARKRIMEKEHITWANGEIVQLIKGDPVEIIAIDNISYWARHVFDSRIDPELFEQGTKHTYLKQHFVGWVIETEKEVFDPEVFTMMDYRLVYPGSTSFTYILPVSPNKGLVEYTFFSPDEVEKSVYETYIKKYINEYLKKVDYRITKKESGVIPMTDFPFHRFNDRYVTKIGTAGGWVKGSTGYSFKNAIRKSARIVENLKNHRTPANGLSNRRFRIYDALFLDVLYNHNEIGPELFRGMYDKNDIEMIFRFLDEETSFAQELKIMNTFDKLLFSRTILKRMLKQ